MDEIALRAAAAEGDGAATERLARHLGSSQRIAEAAHLLRTAVRRDPSRVSALRELHRLGARLGATAEAAVLGAILSFFDRAVDVPLAAGFLDDVIHPGDRDLALHPPAENALRRLLALVWEGAAPLFRKSLQSLGVIGTQRVSPLASTGLARAYRAASGVLGLAETPLFVRSAGGRELVVAATQPPSVLAGPAVDGHAAVMRFRVARALELTRPAHVLVSTLSPSDGETLLAAVGAAFGPSETTPTVPRAAAALASELWRTMPAPLQREVRDLLVSDGPFGYEPVRAAVLAAGSRAGLLAAGQIEASVRGLAADDSTLTGANLSTEEGFANACRSCTALADLIRFALSDTYLAACARAKDR